MLKISQDPGSDCQDLYITLSVAKLIRLLIQLRSSCHCLYVITYMLIIKFGASYAHHYFYSNSEIFMPFALELLNEEEFGEAARNTEYDDTTINSASGLGLTVRH